MSDTNSHFPGPAFGHGLASLPLPADLVHQLNIEAKASKKTVTELIGQWLEDQADSREAAKIMKRIKEGKEEVYPAAEVWARHGI